MTAGAIVARDPELGAANLSIARLKPPVGPYAPSESRTTLTFLNVTRISTLAGRVGVARERKSRTGPRLAQKGQVSVSVSDNEPPPSATGASQWRHASVPLASRPE